MLNLLPSVSHYSSPRSATVCIIMYPIKNTQHTVRIIEITQTCSCFQSQFQTVVWCVASFKSAVVKLHLSLSHRSHLQIQYEPHYQLNIKIEDPFISLSLDAASIGHWRLGFHVLTRFRETLSCPLLWTSVSCWFPASHIIYFKVMLPDLKSLHSLRPVLMRLENKNLKKSLTLIR